MKQVYQCDFCNFIGTAEEVKDHEAQCSLNPNPTIHNCTNCMWGVEIPQTISADRKTITPVHFGCMHREPINYGINSIDFATSLKSCPAEMICEHWAMLDQLMLHLDI